MSGKSDVVDGCIIESHGAWTLRTNDRQRHGYPKFPTLGLQPDHESREGYPFEVALPDDGRVRTS